MLTLERVAAPAGRVDPRPHALAIGSGFGGLAAAVRLGARGYRVTVVEKLDAPGGRALVHRQDGFTFDAGPTVITAPFLFEELWALCGKRLADDVELRPVAPFYRVVFDDGEKFDYCGDAAAMRAEVARIAPGDVDGYERFLAMSERIFAVGFEALGDQPFDRWTDMVRVAPDLIRLERYRTVWSLACKHGRDQRRRWTDARIERARYSMSLFVWYFGTRRRSDDVAHHTILLGPRSRELLGDIFDKK